MDCAKNIMFNAGATAALTYATVSQARSSEEDDYTASYAAAGSAVASLALQMMQLCITPRHQESARERLGRFALKIPMIQHLYQQSVDQEYRAFQAKTREKWAAFGTPYHAIPQTGLSTEELRGIIFNP